MLVGGEQWATSGYVPGTLPHQEAAPQGGCVGAGLETRGAHCWAACMSVTRSRAPQPCPSSSHMATGWNGGHVFRAELEPASPKVTDSCPELTLPVFWVRTRQEDP